jgi:exonuclease SbcC
MKIKRVELHAFRAYKNRDSGTFNFIYDDNISNFISIYAPNGFGKTSFYDGVEWCMTNKINRFSKERKDNAFAERQYIFNANGEREKQYILKNKDASETENGEVNLVFSDDSNINRLVPNVGRGSSDYSFDTDIERKFFKDVVLSQEAIDSFLREDNSRARFKKFIDYFGNEDDIENHDKLQKLIKKNDTNISGLEKEKKEIEIDISKDFDRNVFNNSNELINELHKDNIKFDLITSKFGEDEQKELYDKIDKYNIYCNSIINENKKKLTELSERELEQKNYINRLEKIDKLIETLINLEQLKENYKKLDYLKKEELTKQKDIEEIEDLISSYPIYKEINSLITQETKKNEHNNLVSIKLKDDLASLNKDMQLNENSLKEKAKQKSLLENFIIQIPLMYNDLEVLDKEVFSNETLIKEATKNQLDLKKSLNDKEKEGLNWGSILEAAKQNIFPEIRDDNRFKSLVIEIETLIKEISPKEEALKKLIKEESSIKGYKSQVEELISIGNLIINKNSSSLCPLCSKEHGSYENLNTSIMNNPILNKIEKEYLERKNLLEKDIIFLEKNLNIKKNSLLNEIKDICNKLEENIKVLMSQDLKSDNNLYSLSEKNKKCLEKNIILRNKLNNMNEADFLSLKKKELELINKEIEEENIKLNKLKSFSKEKNDALSNLDIEISNIFKLINSNKENKSYVLVKIYVNQFEKEIVFEDKASSQLNNLKMEKDELLKNIKELNMTIKLITEKYSIISSEDIEKMTLSINSETKTLTLELGLFNVYLKNNFKDIDISKISLEILNELFTSKKKDINDSIIKYNEIIISLDVLSKYSKNLVEYFNIKNNEDKLENINSLLTSKERVKESLSREIANLENKIEMDVKSFFYEDTINKIYSKIDPHPEYKNVRFESTFKEGKGYLDVFVEDNESNLISPSLYYSSAQLNALSLSIFLAKALHVKDNSDNSIDCIFIDDPIQSMDSINILATIDLFRSLVVNHNKQIILSTHDKNFHELLKKKIPSEVFGSTFIKLETFGKAILDM